MTAIAIQRTVDLPFDTVVERVKETLLAEGFGVLTEIDFQAKMKEKLGHDMDRYLILGACNPALAWDAVEAVPELGVLLPCNVVVRDVTDGVEIMAMEPEAALGLIDDDTVHRVGGEASERLHRAVAAV